MSRCDARTVETLLCGVVMPRSVISVVVKLGGYLHETDSRMDSRMESVALDD